MCIFEYNEERVLRYIKEDEYELGKAEGEKFGRNIIINMLRKGMSDEQICEYADCDVALVDEVKKTL